MNLAFLCKELNVLLRFFQLASHMNDIVIALDSTGIEVANRGEWFRHKWNVGRGYTLQ